MKEFWNGINKILKSISSIFTKRIGDNIEKLSDKELKKIYSLNHTRLWVFSLIGYSISALLILKILMVFEIKQNPVQITLLIILFHFIISWLNTVRGKERGAVYFLGKPLYNVGRGICFVPWLVCTLDKQLRTFFEDELPTTQDKIYRSEKGKPDFIPPELQEKEYKHPIRATFAGMAETVAKYKKKRGGDHKEVTHFQESEIDDPFEERLTLEVPGVIFWSIEDLIKFNSTIGNIEKARKQMADVYISIVTTDLPQMTVKEFYRNRKRVDKKIFKELDKLTDKWGVKIHVARIKEPKQSHNLNAKIQEMSEAKAKKRSNELEGKGLGNKEKAILYGRTDGLLYMAKKLNVKPESILASETAREIAKDVDNLVAVGGKGYADLMSMVAAGAGALQPKTKKITKEKNGGEL